MRDRMIRFQQLGRLLWFLSSLIRTSYKSLELLTFLPSSGRASAHLEIKNRMTETKIINYVLSVKTGTVFASIPLHYRHGPSP